MMKQKNFTQQYRCKENYFDMNQCEKELLRWTERYALYLSKVNQDRLYSPIYKQAINQILIELNKRIEDVKNGAYKSFSD